MEAVISPLELGDDGANVVNLKDAILLLINKVVIQPSAAEAQSFKDLLSRGQQHQAYKDGTSKAGALFQQHPNSVVVALAADDLYEILKS